MFVKTFKLFTKIEKIDLNEDSKRNKISFFNKNKEKGSSK